MNLDKLTAFLEELRVSRSRTVSLGTLSCALAASAADHTHIVEVRYGCCQRPRPSADSFCAAEQFLRLLAGNHWLHGLDLCIARHTCKLHSLPLCLRHNVCCITEHELLQEAPCCVMSVCSWFHCSQAMVQSRYMPKTLLLPLLSCCTKRAVATGQSASQPEEQQMSVIGQERANWCPMCTCRNFKTVS